MTNGKGRGLVSMASALRATFAFNWRARVARKSTCGTRDRERHQALASELGATWAGDAFAQPPVKLDASIVFAPAGEIVPVALKAIRKGGTVGSAEDIWNEIRSVWPAGRGITYERLDSRGLQWPCSDDDHSGTEVMHTASFPIGRAALRRVPYRPTDEIVDDEFPLLLITGRTLYQFNAGTMTMRTPNVKLRPADLLDISSDDAKRLKLHEGERVRIRSRYGEATIPIRITSTVIPGQLFATFHTSEVFLNRVTSPHRDRYVKSPEYKVTAVKIEKG